MSDTEPEPEPAAPAELTKTELREKVARLETENEVLRAAQDSRRPLIDQNAGLAIGLIVAAIVLAIWSTLDPEVAFTGIATFLGGAAFTKAVS